MSDPRPLVGIDLGTTHTVVAYAFGSDRFAPEVFLVPQLVSATEVEPRPLYPSFLYVPVDEERARTPDTFGDAPYVTGELAKRRAAEVPGRVITSAKSWLCHPGVDRTAPILPWGGAVDGSAEGAPLARLSPLEASARLLAHVRRAWDAANAATPLALADVVLTVPASFDETARELTVRAAALAGLEVSLLEEPLAAFYDFLHGPRAADLVALTRDAGGEAHLLVVDVGGGTTDLSLLRATLEEGGGPAVERVAVGRHLLLGGDNMDLALAHLAESRLMRADERLDAARFAQLTGACRHAKEVLLAADGPERVAVTVAARGSRLVGATLATELARDDVARIVLDGFFPLVDKDAKPERRSAALVTMGLPYERDVAISRHIADFVARHLPAGRGVDALLLNGGVFNAPLVGERLAAVVAGFGREPRLLPHADPDLAVARGAVAYGLARRGVGLRVAAGASRAYYIGLDAKAERGVCVVPRGAPEGTRLAAHVSGLALTVGRPVRFDLYTSDDAPEEVAGALVDLATRTVERAPPLTATFELDARGGPAPTVATLPVHLESTLTTVGTLDLACVENAPPPGAAARRFRLEFALRFDDGEAEVDRDAAPASAGPAVPRGGASLAPRSLPPRASSGPASGRGEARDAEARELLERAFGKPRSDATGREAKDLWRDLERVLGERSTWTMERVRGLYDVLAPMAKARRRSADHERTFWMLAGYLLRPGFGAPGDDARATGLAALFAERLAFPDEPRGYPQFFIAWRRVAGGLDEATQTAIRDFVDPFLAPKEAGLKRPKKPKLEADPDMIDLAASLERAPAARRAELASWLLERTWTDRDPRLWAALGRIGARIPGYASLHHVVAPHVAERILEQLLREKWNEVPTAARAALELARLTGDRARDCSSRLREEAAKRLELLAAGTPEPVRLARLEWARALREVVAPSAEDRAALLGDDLPPALVLQPAP